MCKVLLNFHHRFSLVSLDVLTTCRIWADIQWLAQPIGLRVTVHSYILAINTIAVTFYLPLGVLESHTVDAEATYFFENFDISPIFFCFKRFFSWTWKIFESRVWSDESCLGVNGRPTVAPHDKIFSSGQRWCTLRVKNKRFLFHLDCYIFSWISVCFHLYSFELRCTQYFWPELHYRFFWYHSWDLASIISTFSKICWKYFTCTKMMTNTEALLYLI